VFADVAWVIGSPFQGHGYAGEAAASMATWLRAAGVRTLVAHIHPAHAASGGVARAIGLVPTAREVDGEVRWQG
jgi:RimJ/RimL family protein N-acetyltransferase